MSLTSSLTSWSSWSLNLRPTLQSLITNNPIYRNNTARDILFAIGAAYVAKKAFCLASSLFSLIPFPKDLAARYGKGSWAVITGASDGIGKAFALELASRGFNIVLVSRTAEKLNSAAKEITDKYPGIKTRIVVADFVNSAQEGFAERIFEQVKDLDVSILINNAGRDYCDAYLDISMQTIRELVLMNCLSHSLVTRAFLPNLASRAQKSAIINISSTSSITPLPYIDLYCATKVFIDYLSRGLAYEHPNMDILSVKPGGVSTGMINNRKPDFKIITTEEFVKATLSELGNTSETNGHWKHKLYAWQYKNSSIATLRKRLDVLMQMKREEAKKKQQTNA